MDKKEYIIRQLAKTKNKKYEQYVVTRIVNLLDDWNIKFVTQQHVSRPNGRALTDLFFPQIDLHIEVNESQHFRKNEFDLLEHIEEDKIREADIINATGHRIININATKDFESVNEEIDDAVSLIKQLVSEVPSFTPWDIDKEFDTQTYINKGYIDISDDVKFRKIKDACNCFGYNYLGCQRGYIRHPIEQSTHIWFPLLNPIAEKVPTHGDWDNRISQDEITITTAHLTDLKRNENELDKIKKMKGDLPKRIIFVKVKGNLGMTLYRFRGLYELSRDISLKNNIETWKRTDVKVKTYPHVEG